MKVPTRILNSKRIKDSIRVLDKLDVDRITVGAYVSYNQEPTTTLALHFHTIKMGTDNYEVEYRKEGIKTWSKKSIDHITDFLGTDKGIVWCELTGLEPDTTYEFRLTDQGRVFKSKTMPDNLDTPLKIIFGGDLYHDYDNMDMMNAMIASKDPDLVVVGGD